MILLDTNVVSEAMKANAAPSVSDWLDSQVAESLYLTAVNVAELLVGVETLPAGKHRDGIGVALAALISKLFDSRILPFDEDARGESLCKSGRAPALQRHHVGADAQSAGHCDREGFRRGDARHRAVRRRGRADPLIRG